ncbi:MAG: hypothetical protein M3452_07995 [Chloroflexota bacterium]|nr:hypothetical protein [Chloroflexota bacterium]
MPAPWFIGGGAVHDATIARLVANAATGDSQGIVGQDHYKVLPLAVPGAQVRVLPGAGVLRAAPYTGGSFQSYMTRRAVETNLAVTPTGSAAGRSDLVIQRIDDPQFGGTLSPTSPTAIFDPFVIIGGVPAGTTSASELNLPYPAMTLARIDLPANTGAVEGKHIRDLRRLTIPAVPAWECGSALNPAQNIPTNANTGMAVSNFDDAVGLASRSAVNAPAFVTIATAGRYSVSMSARFGGGGGAGGRTCYIAVSRPNAAVEIRVPGSSFNSASGGTVSASGLVRLLAGDVISPALYQESGVGLIIGDLAGTAEIRFSGAMISR